MGGRSLCSRPTTKDAAKGRQDHRCVCHHHPQNGEHVFALFARGRASSPGSPTLLLQRRWSGEGVDYRAQTYQRFAVGEGTLRATHRRRFVALFASSRDVACDFEHSVDDAVRP